MPVGRRGWEWAKEVVVSSFHPTFPADAPAELSILFRGAELDLPSLLCQGGLTGTQRKTWLPFPTWGPPFFAVKWFPEQSYGTF